MSQDRFVVLVESLSDNELSDLIAAAGEEAHKRAVSEGDFDALTEYGFDNLFDSKGMARDPEIISGIIVCAGSKNDRSQLSHDCAFVSLGKTWVWDSEWLEKDTVRYLAGPKTRMRSVSLVVAHEGQELDLVYSHMRSGAHQMKKVRSFKVKNGQLVLVSARAREAENHR